MGSIIIGALLGIPVGYVLLSIITGGGIITNRPVAVKLDNIYSTGIKKNLNNLNEKSGDGLPINWYK